MLTNLPIPNLDANGAKIMILSRAMCFCLSVSRYCKVSRLCHLSANFNITTLRSWATDIRNLRSDSTNLSLPKYWTLSNLLTPSTKLAISSPKFFLISSIVTLVSSMVSWSRAAQISVGSIPSSKTCRATGTQWSVK